MAAVTVHLVDGTFELFRTWFGAPSSIHRGREIGASRALLRSLAAWLRGGDVTHVGVAFDYVIESFRNQLFAGYKTGDGIEPALLAQFPLAEQALRRREELRQELLAAMVDVDVAITACQPAEAPRLDAVPRWDSLEAPSFTQPFNAAGFPAMSICSGFGEHGLPLAIQLVARPFEEAVLLRAGHAFEQATPHRGRRPAL